MKWKKLEDVVAEGRLREEEHKSEDKYNYKRRASLMAY